MDCLRFFRADLLPSAAAPPAAPPAAPAPPAEATAETSDRMLRRLRFRICCSELWRGRGRGSCGQRVGERRAGAKTRRIPRVYECTRAIRLSRRAARVQEGSGGRVGE